MKKSLITITSLFFAIIAMAQPPVGNDQPNGGNARPNGGNAQKVQKYEAFIYTDASLGKELKKHSDAAQRGLMSDIWKSGVNSAKGIGSGYVTSLVDLGVNAITNLFDKKNKDHEEWLSTTSKENQYTETVSTLTDVNDFYSTGSFDGAMDPAGMKFNGIGCLRMEGKDTVFYVSCHIDRDKLDNIVNHSKFNLVLDTLIISPYHSNLPHSSMNIPFSFKERKNFNLKMEMKITSSWMNPDALLQKDQELGVFMLNIPVQEKDLKNGEFVRYVRNSNSKPRYAIEGESFVVPRSYTGHRNENGEYEDYFGTGEYKVSISITETCENTEEYSKNWNADRKKRKEMQKKMKPFDTVIKTVKSQNWNSITKSWVVTVLKGPASILSQQIIDDMNLTSEGGGAQPQQSNASKNSQPSSSPTSSASQPASGNMPSGDKPSGNMPSGDKPSGDKPNGTPPANNKQKM